MAHRRRALVICCHPPHKDPRVTWQISSLKNRYRVSVLSVGEKGKEAERQAYMADIEEYRSAIVLPTPRLSGAIGDIFTCLKYGIHDYLKARIARRETSFTAVLTLLLLTFRTFRVYFSVLKKEADQLEGNYDLIVASDLDALRVGVYVKSKWGGVLVFDSHENWSRNRPGSNWLHEYIMNIYQRRYVRPVDLVTTVSPLLVSHLSRTLRCNNVTLLPNAAPMRSDREGELATDHEERQAEFEAQLRALADGRLIVVFQGRVAPERGLREIVSAWKYIPEGEAILVMRAPDHPSTELKTVLGIAERSGTLGESVFLLPSVSEDNLIVAASAGDVGIIPYRPTFPNHVMACPNKLSQYMQAGLAIFSNDIPYVREIVEAAECGVIYGDEESPQEVAERIVLLQRDRTRLDELKVNARKYAHETFHWEMFYQQYAKDVDRKIAEIEGNC